MIKSSLTAGVVLGAAALAATVAQAHSRSGGRPLSATLTGAVEVPGPGDPDGGGMFMGRVNPGTRQLCYTLTATNIDAATAAHIHVGASGVAGPVVVTLQTPTTASTETCTTLARDLAKKLMQSASGYYVNVHNAALPAGAVRGQLANKAHTM